MAKGELARVQYELIQSEKRGRHQIDKLERQVNDEVKERQHVEGVMIHQRRDMDMVRH